MLWLPGWRIRRVSPAARWTSGWAFTARVPMESRTSLAMPRTSNSRCGLALVDPTPPGWLL